ncbi:sigma 54-interacting transcriptional regulator [Neomoorella mulderi]|uniref:Propionate catabolism operon regulatory protein n=1 Tax=Moorella mulderi DSM 14980 TaxID=1122241 RepID=A0A151AXB4_9FIRM|nr:sigma 54-interacting transcriptional regulator [Moorella mulderi]KYH32200.1 propionate catabolism operon regulatory protein [Moorella mulderi DSM 14980]
MVTKKSKIGIIGRRKIIDLTQKVLLNDLPYQNNEFVYFQGMFHEAFSQINQVADEIEVFVCGRSHSELLELWFPAIPKIVIKPLPFDIILTVREAANIDSWVHVINSYDLVELNYVKDIFRADIKISQYKFTNQDELNNIFYSIAQQRGKAVVGGSLVCDLAPKYGLKAFYYYSEQAIKQALLEALQLAMIKRELKMKRSYEKLNRIIDLSNVGLIVVNNFNYCIEFINNVAAQILGRSKSNTIGMKVAEVLPETLVNSGPKENFVTNINGEELLCDIVFDEGTWFYRFQEVKRVEKASYNIRKQMLSRPHIAKYNFGDIIGKGLSAVKEIARSYAVCSEANVLIVGPTGTGKELFAASIHNNSPRSGEPFVAVNCAALPENLLESELFGYEEGAFTGAKKKGKRGLIELAHKGTLFLDEIGEMPLPLQAKLLRVLQEREVLRLGGEVLIPVDVRIIAATNVRLEDYVISGKFRSDLYYRLAVLVLDIPPLTERREDILDLIDAFLGDKIPPITISVIKEVILDIYKNYSWPGNVRELQNILERLVTYLMYSQKMTLPAKQLYSDLCRFLKASQIYNKDKLPFIDLITTNFEAQKIREKLDEEVIATALKLACGNKTKAAEILGISRSTFWRRSKNVGGNVAFRNAQKTPGKSREQSN